MGEISSMYSKLEKQSQAILISFVLCWPSTYSFLYSLWGGFSSFSVFEQIVFSTAIESLVLAAYVFLLNGIVFLRKQKKLSYDRTIIISRIFGPVIYSELTAFCVGMVVKNNCESEYFLSFASAFVVIIMLLLFVQFEFKQVDGEYKVQQEAERNSLDNPA